MRHMLAAAALALPAALPAQTPPAPAPPTGARTTIMPTDPRALEFQNAVGYADAVVVRDAAGETIYLSGVVAGPRAGETALAAGYERAFKQIERVLARAGAGWADVVDITTFHTNLKDHIQDFVEVKNRYVKAPLPAWTAIGVSALYEPTAVVEIKVVARKTKT